MASMTCRFGPVSFLHEQASILPDYQSKKVNAMSCPTMKYQTLAADSLQMSLTNNPCLSWVDSAIELHFFSSGICSKGRGEHDFSINPQPPLPSADPPPLLCCVYMVIYGSIYLIKAVFHNHVFTCWKVFHADTLARNLHRGMVTAMVWSFKYWQRKSISLCD